MKSEPAKDTTLETLRGAVITLVVAGHVIGSGGDGGMQVNDDSFLRYFYFTFIEFIQMPLFTVIAGYVYAFRPATYEKIGDFLKKKIWRIMVPMLVVGTCYFLIQYFTPGTNRKGELSDIWKLLFFPYTLFWYLYSLFIVFVIIGFIDAFNKMHTFFNWLVIFSITLFILLIRDIVIPFELPNYLSYKGAMYLLPCFILGVGLSCFKAYFHGRFTSYCIVSILLFSIVIQQLGWFKLINYSVSKDSGVGLLIGLAVTMMLIRIQMKKAWLIWVGSFAYSIYLFHAFATAGSRIIIQQFNIQYSPLLFIVSLAAGLLLPILAEIILDRFKITQVLFLGKSFNRENNLPKKYQPI
jgi:glucans biosynthesis protein C